jgi:peroxiredoxin
VARFTDTGEDDRRQPVALKESRMLELGTPAPDFSLPDPDGSMHSLQDFAPQSALLVAFLCNHCPYVKHILAGFADFARQYGPKGLAIVAVNPNDATSYPDDAPPAMAEVARRFQFTFPYVHDASQRLARQCEAICTPDFFLFDGARKLAYRGQFDDSRPGNRIPVTGQSLRAAADAVLEGRPVPGPQLPSAGCSIKWLAGQAPDWG